MDPMKKKHWCVAYVIAMSCAVIGTGAVSRAAELSDEQFHVLDSLLMENLQFLQDDARQNLDTVQAGLAEAYAASAYGRSKDAGAIRERFGAEAAALRLKIKALQQEVVSRRSDAQKSGVMIALLAQEQAVFFELYRWYRSAVELTNVASSAAGRRNEALATLHAELFRAHEQTQQVLSETIHNLGLKFP